MLGVWQQQRVYLHSLTQQSKPCLQAGRLRIRLDLGRLQNLTWVLYSKSVGNYSNKSTERLRAAASALRKCRGHADDYSHHRQSD